MAVIESPPASYTFPELAYDSVRLAFEEIGAQFAAEAASSWEQNRFSWDLWRAIAATGLFAEAAWPQTEAFPRLAAAFDGLGYGLEQTGALIAVIVHAAMGIGTIRDHAPEPLRSEYLTRLQSGDELLAYAISETQGGTAAFTPDTQLEQRGEDYVMNGRKWHITNAPDATVILVWAADPSGQDISAVLIDSDWDGVDVKRDGDPVGTANAPVGSIFFDNVLVPAEHVLALGEGRKALNRGMAAERCVGPFAALGTLRYMTEKALDFVLDREVAGAPLAMHQHMQRRLTDLRLRVDLSRALARDTLARAVAGQRYYAEASQLKMWMARQLMEASLESAQVMGSYGVQRNQGLHRAALDGLCVTIAGGTEEAHRMFLFNDMVNQRRESEAVKQRRKDEETLRFRQNGAGTE